MSPRRRLAAGAAVLLLAAASAAWGARPRLELGNDALAIDYPAWPALLLASGAAGAALLAVTLRAAPMRVIALAGMLALAGGAADLALYRVEADAAGVRLTRLGGRTFLAWPEVLHVDTRLDRLVVSGPGSTRIDLMTRGFPEAQRAALDRTLARRIHGLHPVPEDATP